MNTTMKKLALATLLAASLPAAHAGVTVSPMLGQLLFDNDLDLDNDLFGSLALGYQFANPWAVELSYLTASPDLASGTGDLDFDQLRLDALYHFNYGEEVMPYLLVGGGNQMYDFGSTDFESSIVNVGGGIKAMITNGLALRTEIRLINDMDLELTSYAVGLGLHYEFGRQSASKPAPAAQPADSDSDGVANSADLCPGTAPGLSVDANGCVMVKDDDKDGVANAADKCPATSAGAAVDADGCYITITETKEVALRINFASNSTEVPASDESQIKEVADFMTQYPLTKVTIEGHTDDSGAAAYNQQLSQRRAEAVAQVLSNRFGIAASRVSAVGYGEEQPIVSNDTAENRAKNRRVTAKVSAQVETIKQ